MGESTLPPVYVKDELDAQETMTFEEGTSDPNRMYAYVHDDPVTIARARGKGFRVELDGEGPKPLVQSKSGDGLIRSGDTVLMSCPMEKWQRRKEKSRKLSADRATREVERVSTHGQRSGIRIISSKEW